jgi:hypothetical protein
MKSGMKCLIESFYQSIRGERELPITYREILLTARIMDTVFQQMYRPLKTTSRAHESERMAQAVSGR